MIELAIAFADECNKIYGEMIDYLRANLPKFSFEEDSVEVEAKKSIEK